MYPDGVAGALGLAFGVPVIAETLQTIRRRVYSGVLVVVPVTGDNTWEEDEALQSHFATPHLRDFMQAIPATITAPPDVKFHTIASSMDLADVAVS